MGTPPLGAPGVRLRDLLPEARFVGADDLRVQACCADSRRVRPGDLFVALSGTRRDGHKHIAEAVSRGAAGVLAQRYPKNRDQSKLPYCVVANTRAAFGIICQALQGHPSQRLKVIGVTGTNGKTTTSLLIAGVLQAAGYPTGRIGTLGYSDGLTVETSRFTTPPAPLLARWLARIEAAGCSHAVMEVSSHALSQSRVAGVTFDAACVTNVRRDHLDYHRTDHRYRRAKARIFSHLHPDGVTIINADDPGAAGYLPSVHGPALTVGIGSAAEITATVVEQHLSEQTFLLTAGNETVPVRTPLIGAHNVYNCLIAAAVGLAYDIGLETVVRGLEAVRSVPGRLERIECGQPFGVFVDYAHTADALAGCLETLRAFTPGRLICVFGAGGDRDRLKRPVMGQVVEQSADVAVVTNDNPRTEDPRAIVDGILEGMADPAQPHIIPDRAEAIAWALAEARQGDCVLIAGKGHEDYQIIGTERRHFDDRECARNWLYSHASDDELTWAGN